MKHYLLSKTSLVIYFLAGFLAIVYLTPYLKTFKLLPPMAELLSRFKPVKTKEIVSTQEVNTAMNLIDSSVDTLLRLEKQAKPLEKKAGANKIDDTRLREAERKKARELLVSNLKQTGALGKVVRPIEDTCTEKSDEKCRVQAMTPFYRALEKTAKKEKGAVTRVGHFGDSLITADTITATVREQLQKRFGDSGHGFIYIAKPWHWYMHQGVFHQASEGWKINRVTFPTAPDGLYGYGGVTFQSYPGNWAIFETVKTGAFGRQVTFFHDVQRED